jgi:hypothetical protein
MWHLSKFTVTIDWGSEENYLNSNSQVKGNYKAAVKT